VNAVSDAYGVLLTPEASRRGAAAELRSERARRMYADYLEGMTLAEVGRRYGVGPERVRQIFAAERLPRRRRGWQHRWRRRHMEAAE
jgi:sigma-70-like protein